MQLSNSKWKDSSNLQHRVTLGVVTSLIYVIRRREKKLKRKAELYYDNSGSPKIRRARRTVEEVYECLGDVYFKRAYRMTYESFRKLADKPVRRSSKYEKGPGTEPPNLLSASSE
jgi:hypothetical protein